eukprot:TRINITY_DN125228_c0_g1_i1.p1 TRINITY_DN125228_c0_g1~~TRINITY_DN125228_c0_g1_i1.p1  ORF type:complete len:454 (-),score=48.66 TRINITY_DN125228_c0_g1_i1:68-1228(-)
MSPHYAVSDVKSALQTTLSGFPSLSGRVSLKSEAGEGGTVSQTVIAFNDAGVPFTDGGRVSECAPDMNAPIPAKYFDAIGNTQPPPTVGTEGNDGEPPMRIKVTQFQDDICLIALSVSHGLVDARCIGIFLEDWLRTLEGIKVDHAPFTYDQSFFPKQAQFGQAPLVSSESIPGEWNKVHRPFEMPTPTPYDPQCTVYRRTCDDMQVGQDQPKLSTNDLICGDVAKTCKVNQLSLVMETRHILKQPEFFGCAIMTLDFEAEAPQDFPALIRSVLPAVRSPEFVAWKLGQGPGKTGGAIVNSWVRAFELDKLGSGDRVKCHAVMLGETFCKARGCAFAGYGVKYALVLPMREPAAEDKLGSSFKICVMGPKEVSDGLPGLLSAVPLA